MTVDLAGDVLLQAADDFAPALALGGSFREVGAAALVPWFWNDE
ncbi:hypothetical protein [Micromonospora deserti]|nr:hypothetical protein [Micromonospora deserti]